MDASTVVAAVAAVFAFVTVLQTRVLLRSALRPELVAHGFTIAKRDGTLLAIGNGGGGLAGPVHYLWIIDGRRYAEGAVGPMLPTGRQHIVEAPTVPSGKSHQGVVGCRDSRGHIYLWSMDDLKPKVIRRRPWRRTPQTPYPRAALRHFYPDVKLDGLEQVETVIRTPAADRFLD